MTEMPRYRPPSGGEPCRACPFRRQAPAGWLGLGTPQSFIVEISMERPLPCHPTIDYEDPDWLDKWANQEIGRICAGSLIMAANMGKLPRDPAFPRLPPDDQAVFKNHREFIQHHEDAETRSWEMPPESEREVRDLTARREETKMAKATRTAKAKKTTKKSARKDEVRPTQRTQRTQRTKTRTRKAKDASARKSADDTSPAITGALIGHGRGIEVTSSGTPRERYVERVRQAFQMKDVGELTKPDYIEALQDLRAEVDGMLEAAVEELGEGQGGQDSKETDGQEEDQEGDREQDEPNDAASSEYPVEDPVEDDDESTASDPPEDHVDDDEDEDDERPLGRAYR